MHAADAGGPLYDDGCASGVLRCCVAAGDHDRQAHRPAPSSEPPSSDPASHYAALECPPADGAGKEADADRADGAGGAVLRHPLLLRLNSHCAVDFVSLAEDLTIIGLVHATGSNVGRWKVRAFKVFLLLPYGVHVAEFLCGRFRILRYPNAVVPPLSEVVQAVLFVKIAGDTKAAIGVFVAFAAVQVALMLGSDECLSEVCRRSIGVGSADMAFFVATGLALFGAVFALLPLFCDPDSYGEDSEVEVGEEVQRMVFDNPIVHAAVTVFLWGIGSFGHVPWLDSVCVCASGAAYAFVTGWSIGHGAGGGGGDDNGPDAAAGRCATFGYLWSVLSVSALLTALWWDGPVLRGAVLYGGCPTWAERVYRCVRSGLIVMGLLAVVPLWMVGRAREALVEGCAMFLALPFAAGCGNYFFYATEMEGARVRRRRSEETLTDAPRRADDRDFDAADETRGTCVR